MPVTRLGLQMGRSAFWEGPNQTMSNTFFRGGEFCRRVSSPLATGLGISHEESRISRSCKMRMANSLKMLIFKRLPKHSRNGTVQRWNVFSFLMSPKCKSSHWRREACRRKLRSSTCPNRTAMRAVYPHVHTLIKSMLTTSCTIATVERGVYQDGGVLNILAKSLRRRTVELQLLWLLCIGM